MHSGVDAGTGYIHTITGTSANVHDSAEAYKLIREDDTVMYGDSGYLGVQNQDVVKNDEHLSKVAFVVNKRPSSLKITDAYEGINWDKNIENRKSSVRSKVEPPFLIVKKQFGYAKTVYKGIEKNMNRFSVLFASANLLMCARSGRTNEFCTGELYPFADYGRKISINPIRKLTFSEDYLLNCNLKIQKNYKSSF